MSSPQSFGVFRPGGIRKRNGQQPAFRFSRRSVRPLHGNDPSFFIHKRAAANAPRLFAHCASIPIRKASAFSLPSSRETQFYANPNPSSPFMLRRYYTTIRLFTQVPHEKTPSAGAAPAFGIIFRAQPQPYAHRPPRSPLGYRKPTNASRPTRQTRPAATQKPRLARVRSADGECAKRHIHPKI